ncbi:hypothetical protein ACLOJK_030216 [Asimina triloba]
MDISRPFLLTLLLLLPVGFPALRDLPDTPTKELAVNFPPYLRLFTDGTVERLQGTDVVPPSVDQTTGVSSKDIGIQVPQSSSGSPPVPARLYLPELPAKNPNQKLPVLVYFHGGAFIVDSPFSHTYHSYLNSLVSKANVVAVSVHYRRCPEDPLPAAYDDAWTALQWTASHAAGGSGPEAWLRDHGDLARINVAGDSAGGNIAHNVSLRAGREELGNGVKIGGAILINPYFFSEKAVLAVTNAVSQRTLRTMWKLACPGDCRERFDSRFINPTVAGEESLGGMGCERVLVCIGGRDFLRAEDWAYYRALTSSGWKGRAEMFEMEGEKHVFHLTHPDSENARKLMQRLVHFLSIRQQGIGSL